MPGSRGAGLLFRFAFDGWPTDGVGKGLAACVPCALEKLRAAKTCAKSIWAHGNHQRLKPGALGLASVLCGA